MLSIQRIIFIINLALVTLGVYFGVSLFYQVMANQLRTTEVTPVAAATPKSRPTNKKQPFSNYRPILQRDLFKTQKSPAPAPPKTDINMDNMAQTQLKLKLWGTVTGKPEQAYAVIEDIQKREQNLYRIGDSIQNATLKLIKRSKVVLSLNGKDEILAMEDMSKASKSKSSVARSASSSGQRRPARRTQRVSLRRSMIDEAMNDVSSLMTQIKIKPHIKDGVPNGLALSNIKPTSIFRRMGLRNGDVLKGVDGQDIRSVDDALRLYDSLKSTDAVSVQLERRGTDRTINYNIR